MLCLVLLVQQNKGGTEGSSGIRRGRRLSGWEPARSPASMKNVIAYEIWQQQRCPVLKSDVRPAVLDLFHLFVGARD